MNTNLKNTILKAVASYILIPCLFVACGAANTTGKSSSDSSADSTIFPTSLAVSSPFEYVESDTGLSSNLIRLATSSAPVTHYAWATGRIDLLLAGKTPVFDVFDPELFFTQENDADCFGPRVDYQEHPEGTPGNTGELPPGDLGIWEEIDSVTLEACSKSQLEARLQGVRDRSLATSMVLASIVGTINANGLSLPDATTTTVHLVDKMNFKIADEGRTDVTFSNVTIEFDPATSAYSYDADFTYNDGTSTHSISVNLTHVSSGGGAYEGILSYIVDDELSFGNCPDQNVTYNGSLQYNRTSNTEIALEVRAGTFCGHGADGRDADGLVDPSDKYNASSNPNGWGNNFSIFTADYNPQNMDGSYSYAWQAGPQDDNSRIFNLSADADSSTGFAYYGYGLDIENTDGGIEGFICNWAGPGSDHDIAEYAQYQEIEIDPSTGLGASTLANITYAPTTTCSYDGSGTFIYDTDGDDDLSDETHSAVNEDLVDGADLDGDTNITIEEVIDASGFVLPSL